MRNDTPSLWWPRLAAFGLSALAAGSAVFWILKWPASQPATSLQSATNTISPSADRNLIARALGVQAAAPIATAVRPTPAVIDATSRMALVGVVANGKNGGSALIAIDGKPARPVRVGAAVDGDWLLQSVAARRAVLVRRADPASGTASGTGQPNSDSKSVMLELPPLKK